MLAGLRDEVIGRYGELAVTIRQRFPDEGASFLRGEVAWDDPDRLAAILLAITWFDERDSHHADLVIECLEHPDEHVVAIAIEDLAGLGGCGLTERVLALGADPRELVRGAVLRFARQVAPDRAPVLLLGALDDPHYIVRENAIDELDELECTPALPRIEALLRDAPPRVRQSALWMIAHLAPSSEAIPLCLRLYMIQRRRSAAPRSSTSASPRSSTTWMCSSECSKIPTRTCVGTRATPSTAACPTARGLQILRRVRDRQQRASLAGRLTRQSRAKGWSGRAMG